MYERRFRLEKKPFAMTPDPGMLYLTTGHREALSGLIYAINEHKGFVVMIGEAGTGKTTLLSRLLRFMPEDQVNFSLVLNPTLSPAEFLESALTDFGITDIPDSKVQRLQRLQQFVTSAHVSGRTCVMIVDEAHKLQPEVLEEIRLLTNFETAEHKLLQIVLVGQSELRGTLNREDLRQLKQRIGVRFELAPLTAEEVEAYVRYRWARAGGQELPFELDAVHLIGRASGGVPRVINAICDNSLISIYATEAPKVTIAHVRQALADLDLGEAPPVSQATKQADRLAASQPVERKAAGRVEATKAVAVPMPGPIRVRPAELNTTAKTTTKTTTKTTAKPIASAKPSFWAKWTEKLKQNGMERRTL